MDSGDEDTEDGFHFEGGSRIVVADCNIRCGDDAIALVHSSGGESTTTAMSDVVISNCYLFSRTASALKIEIADGVSYPISHVSVNNIVAKAGDGTPNQGTSLFIWEGNEEGLVSDISISNFDLDLSQNNYEGLIIRGAKHVRLENIMILKPFKLCRVNGDDIELINCTIDSPRTTAVASDGRCIVFGSETVSSNVRVKGGLFRNSKNYGIQIGSSGFAVTGWEVSGVKIDGAAQTGLRVQNAFDGIAYGNTITGCANGYGIEEAASAPDDNAYYSNYLDNNDDGPILITGAGSEEANNYPSP